MLKNRTSWIAVASSVLFLAAIFFIISREQSFGALIRVWNRIDVATLALAIVLMLIVQALSALRIKIIMGAEKLYSIGYMSLFRIQLISLFVAHGAPISALSDVAKAAMIKLRFALPAGRSIRIILYERIWGALGAVVVGLFCTLVQLFVTTPGDLVHAQLLLWGAGLVAVAILFAIGGMQIYTGIDLLDRVVRAIIGIGHTLRRPVIVARLVLTSLVQLFGFALVFGVLARGMHVQASDVHIVLFMPLIFFVSSLPIFYQGWGGREAVVVAALTSTGQVTSTEAIALSVAFGVVVFLASLPGAAFWIMRPSMRKAIRMEVEQA